MRITRPLTETITKTVGSPQGLTHSPLLGLFLWGIIARKLSKSTPAGTAFDAIVYVDDALVRPESFSALKEISSRLGFELNEKKCKPTYPGKPFKFLGCMVEDLVVEDWMGRKLV